MSLSPFREARQIRTSSALLSGVLQEKAPFWVLTILSSDTERELNQVVAQITLFLVLDQEQSHLLVKTLFTALAREY